MENIVMATLGGMPAADGAAAAAAGAGKADGGLFGAVMDAVFAGFSQAGRPARKSANGGGEDAEASMLLALMLQGLARLNGQNDQTIINTPEAGAMAVQVQAGADGTGPADTAGQLLQMLQGSQSGGGALTRLLAGDRDLRAAVAGLLSGNAEGGGGLQGLLQSLPAGGGESFPALMQALNAGGAADAAAASPKGLAALMEIRALFAELVSGMEQGEPATPAAGTVETAAAAQPALPAQSQSKAPEGLPGAAAASQAPGRLTKALAADILARLDAIAADTQGDAAVTSQPVTVVTLDTAETAEDAAAGTESAGADAGGVSGARRGKEPADFTAALRAYRGEATHAAGQAAPRENSAAMALRQGERAFDAIVDKIASLNHAGQKEMEIRLKPDFLGNVVIKLTMDEGGLTASIAASNPKVQDAFASQAAALQSSLVEQGLKDVRIVVTSSSVQDAALQQQAQGRGQNRQEKQKRNVPAVAALGGPSAAQPLLVYEQAYRTGLVNKLA